jgi:nucleotide-binding universal stress UspA family protein
MPGIIPLINEILYATDLSENSYQAFRYAFSLAQQYSAKIIILHAIEPLHLAVVYSGFEEMVKRHREEKDINEIRRRLQAFCERASLQMGPVSTEVVSKILVPMGHPVEEILTAADEEGCDVIVLGSHGKGFMKQTFLGSVSRQVLERSKRPVFVVPIPPQKGADWVEI